MNCFQIEVRGVTFTIWAPTIQDALETFMIDMELYEVPKDAVAFSTSETEDEAIFPIECGGFQSLDKGTLKEMLMVLGSATGVVSASYILQLLHGAW